MAKTRNTWGGESLSGDITLLVIAKDASGVDVHVN